MFPNDSHLNDEMTRLDYIKEEVKREKTLDILGKNTINDISRKVKKRRTESTVSSLANSTSTFVNTFTNNSSSSKFVQHPKSVNSLSSQGSKSLVAYEDSE